MFFYTYEDFKEDVKILAKEIKKDFQPDALVAVARGGMSLGHSLAVALNNRNLFSLNSIHYEEKQKLDEVKIFNTPNLKSYQKILLIDDIVDSGESLTQISKLLKQEFPQIKLKIATIFYKKSASLIPDFKVKEAKEWVNFFWDIDIN
ncbi:phosphoribosyltransferase [Campylobacter cuniculorum]|uniref:Phosphoribosyltransferase n=2 Tax=Campylobacter cuniculorum TaxID=374106 RepID=A0ABX6TZ74_9BACT|nr:phosphoribosyltransferase family protein [Campylobacter cuniculorum]ARJ57008.1 putative nucleotide phosphoribosyltransferase [Campylobacter cuniculorum DSM 23162 = LMG 24588]QOR04458.1 phosphoribosyltransferase [Campylobacter cuniculorum]